jgi:hypothetical protein
MRARGAVGSNAAAGAATAAAGKAVKEIAAAAAEVPGMLLNVARACVRATAASLQASAAAQWLCAPVQQAVPHAGRALLALFFPRWHLPVSAVRGRIAVKVHASAVPVRPPMFHTSTNRRGCVQTPGVGSKHLLAPRDARMHLYLARIKAQLNCVGFNF